MVRETAGVVASLSRRTLDGVITHTNRCDVLASLRIHGL